MSWVVFLHSRLDFESDSYQILLLLSSNFIIADFSDGGLSFEFNFSLQRMQFPASATSRLVRFIRSLVLLLALRDKLQGVAKRVCSYTLTVASLYKVYSISDKGFPQWFISQNTCVVRAWAFPHSFLIKISIDQTAGDFIWTCHCHLPLSSFNACVLSNCLGNCDNAWRHQYCTYSTRWKCLPDVWQNIVYVG